MMYKKEFEIRWSDVDANKHLANSAYINYMSHTRTTFLQEIGLGLVELGKMNLAPVVFYEHIYYFKELFLGQTVYVSLELLGISEDGTFFSFEHNFYTPNGKHRAHCEMAGAWINFKERKLTPLPNDILQKFTDMPKAKNFKLLTKEDTRKFNKQPVDIIL